MPKPIKKIMSEVEDVGLNDAGMSEFLSASDTLGGQLSLQMEVLNDIQTIAVVVKDAVERSCVLSSQISAAADNMAAACVAVGAYERSREALASASDEESRFKVEAGDQRTSARLENLIIMAKRVQQIGSEVEEKASMALKKLRLRPQLEDSAEKAELPTIEETQESRSAALKIIDAGRAMAAEMNAEIIEIDLSDPED